MTDTTHTAGLTLATNGAPLMCALRAVRKVSGPNGRLFHCIDREDPTLHRISQDLYRGSVGYAVRFDGDSANVFLTEAGNLRPVGTFAVDDLLTN